LQALSDVVGPQDQGCYTLEAPAHGNSAGRLSSSERGRVLIELRNCLVAASLKARRLDEPAWSAILALVDGWALERLQASSVRPRSAPCLACDGHGYLGARECACNGGGRW